MISTETLSDFISTITEDTRAFPSNFVTEFAGIATSTLLNGSVNYDTPVPFQVSGEGSSYTGEMRLAGEGSASIRIIPVDAQSVSIQADYDDHGGIDATIDPTWEALVED